MRTFEPVYYSTFLRHVVLVLGGYEWSVYVLFFLKCTFMPKLLWVFLNFSPSPLVYGTIMKMFLFLEPVLLVLLC